MLLRAKHGAYAGQIIDYPFTVGQNLLDTGFAERPSEEEVAAHLRGDEVERAVSPAAQAAETRPAPAQKAPKGAGKKRMRG